MNPRELAEENARLIAENDRKTQYERAMVLPDGRRFLRFVPAWPDVLELIRKHETI